MRKEARKKAIVLMSGGVDSSMAAVLLKNLNYELIGFHLKVSKFCNPQDELDARLVAEKFNFPLYSLDISQDYQRIIALETIKEYARGFTPNPDVFCNSQIKFGWVLNFLKNLEIKYIASGHYAKIVKINGYNLIALPKDLNKDQTYFLWKINKKYLKNIIFPLGDYLKSEVRELAKKNNLPNAEKKDSQGICFLGKIKLRDFLGEYLPIKKGLIVDSQGNFLGYHPGYYFFTEGQRQGLNIAFKPGPYYLAVKDFKKNILIVAKNNEPILFSNKIKFKNFNLLVPKIMLKNLNLNNLEVLVRCRYRQDLIKARLDLSNKLVYLSQPLKGVALGQSVVFYLEGKKLNEELEGEIILLGGGIIKQKFFEQ